MSNIDPFLYVQKMHVHTVTFRRGKIARFARFMYRYIKRPRILQAGYYLHNVEPVNPVIGKVVKVENGITTIKLNMNGNDE